MLFWVGKIETQWQNCPKALNEPELDAHVEFFRFFDTSFQTVGHPK
jgi:hypothetical protein